ncbi:hypothetical protein GCM10020218_045480 [Dactylosporangium vinaceum]
MVIELGDVGVPWTPVVGPRPRVEARRRRRAVAFVVVLLVGAGLLVASARERPGALFSLPGWPAGVELADGRVYVTRSQPDVVEARTAEGRLLWSRPRSSTDQGLAAVTGGVAVLSTQYGGESTRESLSVVAVDAETGAELWRRAGARVEGPAGDLFLLEDVAGPHRLLGLAARTGAPVWSVDLPADALLSWNGVELSSLDELDPDGTLIRREPLSGAVTVRRSLQQWPGKGVYLFQVLAGQVVTWPADHPGADVYDLATGRLRWPFPGEFSPQLVDCGPGRLCTVGGDGVRAYDAATGRPLWVIREYNEIFGHGGDRMMLGGYGNSAAASHEPVVFTVDSRTGARIHRLDGWIATNSTGDGRTVVFHPDPGRRDGIVGLYDRWHSGVRVLGRGVFPIGPYCAIGHGLVACVNGDLMVWRIP